MINIKPYNNYNSQLYFQLQCDLLELRDAHAKLRTTNEKLRREKERWDKESRTLQRSRMKNEEDERKIHLMVENVDMLLRLLPQTKDGNYDISRKKVRFIIINRLQSVSLHWYIY